MKKEQKGVLAILLILIGLTMLVFTGCPTDAGEEEEAGPTDIFDETPMTSGYYTAKADSYFGPQYDVTILVTEHQIKEITHTSDDTHNSDNMGQVALGVLTERILTHQTSAVDGVSGCTMTSYGFKAAVEAALKQAGASDRLINPTPKSMTNDTINVDVLIMGSGITGLSAANAAKKAQPDARVLLIEKSEITGGTTKFSALVVTMPINDEEDPEKWATYLKERAQGWADDHMLTAWSTKARAAYENITGQIFPGGMATGTMTEARMAMGSTANYIAVPVLTEKARAAGVTIWTGVAGTKLLTNEAGDVTGAEAVSVADGITYTFNVKGGVVLATGGFDNNSVMLQKYNKTSATDRGQGTPSNTGDGINMGIAIGADSVFKGGRIGWLVRNDKDPNGAASYYPFGRFHVIATDGTFLPAAGPEQGAKAAGTNANGITHPALEAVTYANSPNDYALVYRWMIDKRVDNKDLKFWNLTRGNANANYAERGWAYSAATLEELAATPQLGMTPEQFTQAWNDSGVTGSGNYTVTQITTSSMGSMGGLKINEDANVVRPDASNPKGKPIAGLYAGGETANGQVFYQDYPGSGHSLSFGITFGNLAGTNAANRAF